jgi:large subunit ribosomal protein L9
MQIILQEDVEKLGTRGELVEVAAGYARNYLLPHKLALEATANNIKRLEKIRVTLAKRTATEKDAAHQQAALLNEVTVSFKRKAGETDQLFGSVTSADVADALAAQGFQVDKRRIALDEPLKVLGESMVAVKLVHGVTAQVKAVIERDA